MTDHSAISMSKRLLLAAVIATAGLSAGVHAAPASDYGHTEPATASEKLINISADTKTVNVDNGDTVTFVSGHQTFTWNFRTLRDEDDVRLSTIAPAGFPAKDIEVYVARDPLYR